jgi:antitoxin component of MazEF toxin-antitoxin module
MVVVETRLKKWGNSLGLIIPKEVIDMEKLKEEEKVRVIVVSKNSSKVLRETFGMLKGKIKKSTQQIKDELRRELYND